MTKIRMMEVSDGVVFTTKKRLRDIIITGQYGNDEISAELTNEVLADCKETGVDINSDAKKAIRDELLERNPKVIH